MASIVKEIFRSPVLKSFQYRTISHQLPFDLDDADEKYKDLNRMYIDMFAETSDTMILSRNDSAQSKAEVTSELDELNTEVGDLLEVGYHRLNPVELERIVESPGRFILQSLSHNPYYNLALENYIFANTPANKGVSPGYSNQRLLFYLNSNCVVIGKNQTVWKELYLNNVINRGYELLRRFSGGGTVVHDLGNVNYSFITSRDEFQREFFNKLIVKWLTNSYSNMPLNLNERGDITFGGRKVSGSAFKIAKGKSYHHGTMLINSNLDEFHGLLKPEVIEGISWNCNSVNSVRSEVTKLNIESPQQFIDICVDGFKQYFSSKQQETAEIPLYYCDESVTINGEIRQSMSTLKSVQWKYMTGPKFQVNVEKGNHSISVEKGIISESSIPGVVGLSFKEFTEKLPDFNSIDPKLIL